MRTKGPKYLFRAFHPYEIAAPASRSPPPAPVGGVP
jgi:hypothetical protein